MGWYGGFPPYVSVAERKRKAEKTVQAMHKKGQATAPVLIEGRKIATTFWGKAWCDHLESFSDYENRLPRGRTYVRNGSVIDLQLKEGEITALVSGSYLYQVSITIKPVEKERWQAIVKQCFGKIASLIELLQGRFSEGVMAILCDATQGLFPQMDDIQLRCSCPDWATMCKHVAAVLYGVGVRLDQQPEALFLLRQADQSELVSDVSVWTSVESVETDQLVIDSDQLSSLFGIVIDDGAAPALLKNNEKTAKKKRSKMLTRSKPTGRVDNNIVSLRELDALVKKFLKSI